MNKKLTNKFYYFVLLIISLINTSCRFNIDKSPTELMGISKSNTCQSYKAGSRYTFSVDQVLVCDTLQFLLTMDILKNKKIFKTTSIEYKYFYDDKTIINYHYQGKVNEKSNKLESEFTSFKYGDWIFLHPPRSYTLKTLQLAPFPQFNKGYNKTSGTLLIPKNNWDYWENSSIDCSYSIDSVYYTQNSIADKYFISSKANSIYGENSALFIYQVDSGFTRMEYSFENGDWVKINLLKITE